MLDMEPQDNRDLGQVITQCNKIVHCKIHMLHTLNGQGILSQLIMYLKVTIHIMKVLIISTWLIQFTKLVEKKKA